MIQERTFITLKQEKELLQEKIDTVCNNPQDYKIKKWLKNPNVQVKRLLMDMVRQGFITIEFVAEGYKVRRVIKNKTYIKDIKQNIKY